MGSVKEIEQTILCLSPNDFDAFREWFVEFDSAAWDGQLEDDISRGRLDAFADEAISDLKAGRCTKR